MNGIKFGLMITIFALLGSVPLTAGEAVRREQALIVFAASSLTDVLTAQSNAWASATGNIKPKLAFGASATMARQIQSGAPANLFISANPIWTQSLVDAGRAQSATSLISNRLVLVVPANESYLPPFKPSAAGFNELLKGRRLALADPVTAPAGQYAKSYLMAIDLWQNLEPRLAYAPNVRQALRLVEAGGIPAFVYESDALASPKTHIAYTVPEGLSPPILYQAAVIQPENAAAHSFLNFLTGQTAVHIWEKHGFRRIASN